MMEEEKAREGGKEVRNRRNTRRKGDKNGREEGGS